jgi:hypothetical protein
LNWLGPLIFRVSADLLCSDFEVSVMTERRTRREPVPHLQTRPATMLTAIGLCALIVLIQLVPEVQSMVRLPASAVIATH